MTRPHLSLAAIVGFGLLAGCAEKAEVDHKPTPQTLACSTCQGTGQMEIKEAPPAAVKLVYGTRPRTRSTIGATWRAFTVRIVDSSGDLVTTAENRVTISLASGTETLSGTLSQDAVKGIATFDDLSYNVAENIGFDITAENLIGIGGTRVAVTPTSSPTPVTAGATWPTFTVRIENSVDKHLLPYPTVTRKRHVVGGTLSGKDLSNDTTPPAPVVIPMKKIKCPTCGGAGFVEAK